MLEVIGMARVSFEGARVTVCQSHFLGDFRHLLLVDLTIALGLLVVIFIRLFLLIVQD